MLARRPPQGPRQPPPEWEPECGPEEELELCEAEIRMCEQVLAGAPAANEEVATAITNNTKAIEEGRRRLSDVMCGEVVSISLVRGLKMALEKRLMAQQELCQAQKARLEEQRICRQNIGMHKARRAVLVKELERGVIIPFPVRNPS